MLHRCHGRVRPGVGHPAALSPSLAQVVAQAQCQSFSESKPVGVALSGAKPVAVAVPGAFSFPDPRASPSP